MADTSFAPSSPSLGRPVRGGAHPPWPERDAGRPARRFLLDGVKAPGRGFGGVGCRLAHRRQLALPLCKAAAKEDEVVVELGQGHAVPAEGPEKGMGWWTRLAT